MAGVAAMLAAAGCSAYPTPQTTTPAPRADELQPGLSVRYYWAFFRHVDEFDAYRAAHPGDPGPPLAQLNYRTGKGNVLTSGGVDGIAADITGYIRLDRTGIYEFVAQSNDGVAISIGGISVIEDPTVHSDRFSTVERLEVTEAGWYPIQVLYFERKETSTLELYWRQPGELDGPVTLVPAEALAHRRGT